MMIRMRTLVTCMKPQMHAFLCGCIGFLTYCSLSHSNCRSVKTALIVLPFLSTGVKMFEAPNAAFSHRAIVGRIWDQTVLVSGKSCIWDLILRGNMGKVPEMPWFNTGQPVVSWPLFLSEMAILNHIDAYRCIIRKANACKIPVLDSFSTTHSISRQKKKTHMKKNIDW